MHSKQQPVELQDEGKDPPGQELMPYYPDNWIDGNISY